MKTMKFNLSVLVLLMTLAGSAFGQKVDYKLESYQAEGSSAVRLEKTESVDSVVVYSEFEQEICSKKIENGDEVGYELGGDITWYVKIITKNKGIQWYRLHRLTLEAVKKPF
jgi:hypothetical protein